MYANGKINELCEQVSSIIYTATVKNNVWEVRFWNINLNII